MTYQHNCPKMKDQIRNYCHRYIDLTAAELDVFFNSLTVKNYQKKDYLLQEGEICKIQFFIVNGLTRSYYVNDKGQEEILQFGIENWWVTQTESFVKEMPSQLSIQTLEETVVLVLSKKVLEELYTSIPKIERLFRIIAENTLVADQRRSHFYMKLSSKERYLNFINSFPKFAQRVPQYMIASYLQITPEYLSALRKNY